MGNIRQIRNSRTNEVIENGSILENIQGQLRKLPIFKVADLDKVNVKSRINAAKNDMNLFHNNVI